MLPYVSIVIPAFNEERYIGRCLHSLFELNYPKDRFDIIVVDNGSEDRTVKICRDLDVRVEVKPGIHVGAVRNYGAAQSQSDIIAFVDSDCEVGPEWLNSAVKVLQDDSVGAVGGACLVPDNAGWVEKTWSTGLPQAEQQLANVLAGSCFIVPRSMFVRNGGFDSDMTAGEDSCLSHRIKQEGRKLLLVRDCAVYHLDYPKTLKGFVLWQSRLGQFQIESAKSMLDKLLIFSHAYAAASLCVILSTVLLGISSTAFLTFLFALMFLLAIPAAACIHRLSKYGDRLLGVAGFMRLYLVLQAYFLGRSIGLVINYRRLIFGGK